MEIKSACRRTFSLTFGLGTNQVGDYVELGTSLGIVVKTAIPVWSLERDPVVHPPC